MDMVKAAIGPVLVGALAGGLIAFFLGWAVLGVIDALGGTDGSTLMGYAIGLLFFWTPLGAALGALLGAGAAWRSKLR